MGKTYKNRYLIIIFAFLLSSYSCEENPDIVYSKIDGIYKCAESSAYSGIRKYLVEIDQVQSQDNLFIISNFHNQGDINFLYAELVFDTLYINNQIIGSITVQGKGAVRDDFKNIDFYYETDDGILQLDYYATYSR